MTSPTHHGAADDQQATLIVVGGETLPPELGELVGTVVRINARVLAATLLPALLRGPVVVVVPDDAHAAEALRMGADEVVVIERAQRPQIELALARASLRARGRRLREQHVVDLVRTDDASALQLLASALGERLDAPLAFALAHHASAHADSGQGAALEQAVAIVRSLKTFAEQAHTLDSADAALLLEQAVAIVRPTLLARAQLIIDIPEVECWVPLPAWQLLQSVLALLDNAASALRDEGASGVIQLALVVQDDVAVVEVWDNGSGMSPAERLRAVDPFFSGRGPRALGLGLSLVASRVRRAGGELIIDSTPDTGTAVRLFLPRLSHGPDAPPGERGN